MKRGHTWGKLALGAGLAIAVLATVLLLLSGGPAVADETTYTVSGRVTDLSTGLPIPNVGMSVLDAAGQTVEQSPQTDHGGYYSFVGLPPGLYQVLTNSDPGALPGYLPQWYTEDPSFHDYFQTDSNGTEATWVEVASTNVEGIDFALTPGHNLSGTVTDRARNPVSGVHMLLLDPATGESVSEAGTDEHGHYSTSGLLPGSYKVRTQAIQQDYVNQWYSKSPPPDYCQTDPDGTGATPVVVGSANVRNIDFALAAGYMITGEVKDASTGLLISNEAMAVYDAAGRRVSGGLTGDASYHGDAGYYSSDALLPGLYKVQTTPDFGLGGGSVNLGYVNQWYPNDPVQTDPSGTTATWVKVGSADVKNIDFALTAGYTISGRVTDKDGNPIPNVGVQIYDAAGQDEIAVQIDDGVNYSTGALIPGSYRVRTQAIHQGYLDQWYSEDLLPDYCQTDPSGTKATLIPVVSADAKGIDFSLALGYSISGRVTDSTNPNPLTNGIPEVNMIAFDEFGNEVNLGKSEGLDTTNSDGHYTTIALVPGLYTVRTLNGSGYIDTWYRNDPVQTDPSGTGATAVAIGPANATVDFVLTPGHTTTSSIKSNFNGTSISTSNFIWFNANFKASGVPSSGAEIDFRNSTVSIVSANGAFTYPVPDGRIILDPNAALSATAFETATGWLTRVPVSGSDEILLSALGIKAPADLKGATVTWTGDLMASVSGITLNWKWGAAVYTSDMTQANYNTIGVKPTHTNANQYVNSDHGGTPENAKKYVIGGARGGGGSNYTGSWSGTAPVTLPAS